MKVKQMRRVKILRAAEEMAKEHPEDKDRIMREAHKAIEALGERP